MKPGSQIKRRGFIGAALVGAGAGLGWVARQFQNAPRPRQPQPTALDSRFVYDVSEFEKTDPALLRYRPAQQFDTGFDRVKRITAAPGNRVWVAGDRSLKLFAPDGRVEKQIALDRPPHCMSLVEDEIFIGLGNFFEIHDAEGKQKLRSSRLGENAFLTAMAVHGSRVYLADAGSREILVCERASGEIIDRFGKRDEERGNPGFAVPSPYFDLAMAPDGRLRIVNPGRLRVETYSLDGRFESSWGEPGMRIDRFCGCCNPVYFTLTPAGGFVTSEKGLARINVYKPDGTFEGAVAGPETLVEDKELAKRACGDCRVGAGFDIALDDEGRVLALDPFRKTVRVFEPTTHA
jgi:hypothetical protein